MALPEPSFIERDPAKVTAENIALYESLTGKTLQPAQPEMLMVNQISYRESLIRIGIQEAAKQCLVDYAIYPMIDYLGALVGVERLPAQYAVTTLQFTLSEALAFDLLIPVATLVGSSDGLYSFATDTDLTIPAGSLTGTVMATAETAGTVANDYAIGTITDLLSPLSYIDSVTNITATSGGVDEESDDALRVRIKLAPESFSVAGSRLSYVFWAKSTSQTICDVAVLSPSPGVVAIYPLTTVGTPSQEILDLVLAACSAEDVRPLCDQVQVAAPVRKPFELAVSVTPYAWPGLDDVAAQVRTDLETFAATLRQSLGRDVIVNQAIAVAGSVYGVYRATVTAPAADIINAANEWSDCISITITMAEAVND